VIPQPARDAAVALRQKVIESRARQGLPPTVIDPASLERVAAVLRVVVLADPASSRVRSKGATAEVGRGT
jgi:hypothetical protein